MYRVILHIFYKIGHFFIFIRNIFRKPENYQIYKNQILRELDVLGLGAIGITTFISIFVGAIIAIQTKFNITSPLTPKYLIGFATRESMILEFSPTMIALILAGKIGSRIASEIGSMRITEQIDSLEIMGVNSISYLVLPKVIAAFLIFPFLVILSMIAGIFGGYIVASLSGIFTTDQYIYGITYDFKPFSVTYSIIKTIVFSFIITTISAYEGYYVNIKGGSLDVGRASTNAVVYSSITIIVFNLILTQLLLA